MSARALLLFRLAIVATIAVGAGLQAYMLHSLWRVLSGPGGETASISAVGVGFLSLTLAIVLAGSALAGALLLRSACTPEGRAITTFLACLVYLTAAIEPIHQLIARFALGSLASTAVSFTIPLSLLLGLAALLRFSSVFPVQLDHSLLSGERILRRPRTALLKPRTVWFTAIGIAVAAQASLLIVQQLRIAVPALTSFSFPLHQLIVIVLLMLGMVMGVANLRAGYGAADAAGRRRVYWVMEGLLAGTVIVVFASLLKTFALVTGSPAWVEGWYPLSFFAALLVVIASLGFAMLYAGALDPLLAIRRTAVTGLVGVAMVFIFAVTQQLVHEYLVALTVLSDRVGGMVTGGVVALSFEPVQRRLGRVVARWIEARPAAAAPQPLPESVQAGRAKVALAD
jgi:hypothetical protein